MGENFFDKLSKKTVTWCGDVPKRCDMCQRKIANVFIDGAVTRGWANMCVTCHLLYGHGLGTGCGQQYEKQENGQWVKVKG